MRSLRARMTVGMVGGIAVLLALFGTGVYVMTRGALLKEFDDSLVMTARTLAAAVERDDGKIEMEFDVKLLPDFRQKKGRSYFQFRLADGSTIRRSPSLGEHDLPNVAGTSKHPRFQTVALPKRRTGRAVGIRFSPRSDSAADRKIPGDVILVVARDTAKLRARLRLLLGLLGGAGSATMLMALLVTAAIVRRGLRPLDTLAGRIAAIKEDELTGRVAADDMPAEMAPVAEKLNDLLARVEAAFGRERSFTADAAHELRTPLAGARSTLEVALSRPRDAAESREALADTLAITIHMQAMVDSLLMLARLDAGQLELNAEHIDLSQLVGAGWLDVADRAESRGLTFENQLPPNLSCTSNRELLSMVVADLLSNAVDHADESERVWVTGRAASGSIEITIANTGCRLSRDDVSHVFDRFWRGDSARTDTALHSGLGLTLVRRAVEALGGTVSADVDDGAFTVHVALPAEPDSLPQATQPPAI